VVFLCVIYAASFSKVHILHKEKAARHQSRMSLVERYVFLSHVDLPGTSRSMFRIYS